MILLGLVFGHWWKTTLIVVILGWPVLLLVAGVDIEPSALPAAAALGAANAAVGILVHQALWLFARGLTSAARRIGELRPRT
jgi:riboflavin transporter FmnP